VVALFTSTVTYLIFFLLAPHIAHLAGSDDATPVIRLLAITILIDGVTAVRSATLMRNFQQDKLALAVGAGFAVQAPVAVALAAGGAGPYSFVVGQVCGSVVTAVAILTFTRMPYRLGFDRKVFTSLVKYGAPLVLSLGVEAVFLNAGYALVGKVAGPVQLGFFLLAFNISNWAPGVITTAIRYVSVAGFARLSETDDGLAVGMRRSLLLLVGVVTPIAVLMGVLADPLISGLYGARWIEAAAVLRFLMVFMTVRMIIALVTEALMGAGTIRVIFWMNGLCAVALIPAVLFGAQRYGIAGAGAAHAVVSVLVALPLAWLALNRLGVDVRSILPGLGRVLAAGAAAGVVTFALSRLPVHDLIGLALAGGLGLLVYIAIAVPRWALRDAVQRLRRTTADPTAGPADPVPAADQVPAQPVPVGASDQAAAAPGGPR
jgi:PST family polysaccharide transporter